MSGTVTNSSNTFGVCVNFGCEKDGKLSVPQADWKKYRVGDKVERMVVNKVNVAAGRCVFHVDSCLRTGSSWICWWWARRGNLWAWKPRNRRLASETSSRTAKQVAQRALRWIAANAELRSTFMAGSSASFMCHEATLQKMLAKLICAGTPEEFEPSLALMGAPLGAKEPLGYALEAVVRP